jgi:hypothetical protein
MKDSYQDIRERIGEPPTWFDVHGCPRYGEISVPKHLTEWIACQSCAQAFKVSLVEPVYHSIGNQDVDRVFGSADHDNHEHLHLADDWHYGDPPRHACVGDTMNSIPRHSWDKDHYDYLPSPDLSEEELYERSVCTKPGCST